MLLATCSIQNHQLGIQEEPQTINNALRRISMDLYGDMVLIFLCRQFLLLHTLIDMLGTEPLAVRY